MPELSEISIVRDILEIIQLSFGIEQAKMYLLISESLHW